MRRGWPARAAALLLAWWVLGVPGAGPAAVPASAAALARSAPPGRALASSSLAGLAVAGSVLAGSVLAGSALPGPALDCPAQHGIAGPAGTPWAQQVLGFPAVWDLTRGAGVTVAVIDSGVDANPQFGHRVILGPDLAANNPGVPGLPGVPADADCVGHGTSVAGLIAAAPVAGISFTGVAPAASILSIKLSNTDSFADTVTPEAIRDAVALGASVINLSLATTADTAALRSAVDFALSRNVVVVAAAGNDDEQSGTGPFYPAAYPGVLSVGAVAPDGSLASFSDTRTPVSVTAPGVDITSIYPGAFPDSYDPAENGTSFAAAFVSGVVALVRAYYPGLDQAQVVARIEATAEGAAGPGTGHGRIDPVQAVTAILPATVLSAAPAKPPGHPTHVTITQLPPPDPRARTMTLAVSAGSFGIMLVLLAAATARRRPAARAQRGSLPPGDGGNDPRSRRGGGEGDFDGADPDGVRGADGVRGDVGEGADLQGDGQGFGGDESGMGPDRLGGLGVGA